MSDSASGEQRILIVCHDLSDNVVSRAMVLWELATFNGWQAKVIGIQTKSLWSGASGDFAAACHLLPANPVLMVKEALPHAQWATHIVACKTYPTSFGLSRLLAKVKRRPLTVDIDDFDAELYLDRGWSGLASVIAKTSLRNVARTLAGMHNPVVAYLSKRSALKNRTMASSPALQAVYGGVLVPSARQPFVDVSPHSSDRPVVGFLGTVRPHKGVEVLREAVAALQPQGFSLVVTAPPPQDSKPWETWTGPISYAEVRKLLATVDVVAVPSSSSGETGRLAAGQLSIKLLDAMAAGRACVVGDTESLRWGLSGTGRVVAGPSVGHLVEALEPLGDPELRTQLGNAAKDRAEKNFVVAAVAPIFGRVIANRF